MDEGRGGLLSAGGILSIIVGVFELLTGGIMVASTWVSIPFACLGKSGFEGFCDPSVILHGLTIVGAVLVVLGIMAIVGGVSAIKRRSFGLSLAGAICAILPINTLGILAVIFVSLGKRDFE